MTTKIFCIDRDDHTFKFQRGPDTVLVTMGARNLRSQRIVQMLFQGGIVAATIALGVVFLPFLILVPFAVLAWIGHGSQVKQRLYEEAEVKARAEFDRMERERWAALRYFKP